VANFLTYPIVTITPTVAISLLNIVIWIGLYLIGRFAKRAWKKYIRKQNIHNQQITLAGREITFISLGRQVLNILLVIAALQSLSMTNKGAGLKELLDIKLFEYGKLSVTVFNVSLFIILLVSAKLLTTLMRLFVQRTVADKKWIDKGKEYTIITLAKYFIYTVCIVIGLRSFGFDLTFIVASSAALLVGIGLGVQKIFADIISGFIILFEGTFKVGDIIQIPEGQARIIQINIRTSKARTSSGSVLVIPNSKLTTENINHWSFNNKSVRYSVSIYTEPGTDLAVVKQLLYDCALNHPMIDKKKNIQISLEEFTESNSQLKLFFWTDKIWDVDVVKSDLRFSIEEAFRAHGIQTGTPTVKYLDKEKNTN
jgi:small-conductance mechanosensitive channel